MIKLSPAAQAVLDAYEDSSMSASLDGVDSGGLAAALRAVANRVVPKSEVMPQRNLESRREAMVWGHGKPNSSHPLTTPCHC